MLKAETAAMIMMSGTPDPDLEDITLTENGVYQSVDHDGFRIVTVDTPYGQCAEEVAEMLDIDTSQEWDCDDIKDKIAALEDEVEGLEDEVEGLEDEVEGLEDELEACHDCKDKVVAFIQQYIPDYDPQPDECPADEMPALVQAVQPTLGAKFITANGTYLPASDNLDGYNSVVVDVQSCGCYTFPDDTDINLIPPVVGLDLLYPEDNDYYFQYCIYNRTVDIQFPIAKTITYADVSNRSPYVAVFIYNTSGTHVNTLTLSDAHLLSNDPSSYFKCTNISIDYTNKEVTVDTEYTVYNYGTGWEVRTETRTTSISNYLTTTTPNPSTTVKKKN